MRCAHALESGSGGRLAATAPVRLALSNWAHLCHLPASVSRTRSSRRACMPEGRQAVGCCGPSLLLSIQACPAACGASPAVPMACGAHGLRCPWPAVVMACSAVTCSGPGPSSHAAGEARGGVHVLDSRCAATPPCRTSLRSSLRSRPLSSPPLKIARASRPAHCPCRAASLCSCALS